MKVILASISAVASILAAGAASAQTVVPAGPGPHSAQGLVNLYQTFGPVPCLVNIPVNATGSITGATPAAPYTLCSFGALGSVQMTSDFSFDTIPGDYTKIIIRNLTANALGGTCGPADVEVDVIPPYPPLTVYFDDWIPGWVPGVGPVSCHIEGVITLNNLTLL